MWLHLYLLGLGTTCPLSRHKLVFGHTSFGSFHWCFSRDPLEVFRLQAWLFKNMTPYILQYEQKVFLGFCMRGRSVLFFCNSNSIWCSQIGVLLLLFPSWSYLGLDRPHLISGFYKFISGIYKFRLFVLVRWVMLILAICSWYAGFIFF